jgi:TRAP-type mannitol/chloroaromatic compound transport system permease large subunit
MTWEAATGLIMLMVLMGAIFIGVPISFTLLFLAFTFGYLGMGHTVFDLAYFQTIGMMKEELLAAVPLFIFMGFITEQAGLMERLFTAFRLLLAPVRGALFLVVVLTATVFAMATGIVGAAVTVLGIMASPIMIKSGYDPRLSAGAITAGGTLGILIPPSVMLIVMGPVLGISVADLYAAAFGPGFLLAGLYVTYLLGRAIFNPKLGPPVPMEERKAAFVAMAAESVPSGERGVGLIALLAPIAFAAYKLADGDLAQQALVYGACAVVGIALLVAFFRYAIFRSIVIGVGPLIGLISATLGSILAGLATPTEAAGIGSIGALLLALAYAGFSPPTLLRSLKGLGVTLATAVLLLAVAPSISLTMPFIGITSVLLGLMVVFSDYRWTGLQRALNSTMATSSMVLLLAVTSNVFGAVFARLGTANWITESLLSFQLPPMVMLGLVLILIFLLGWPFEWPAIILVFLPIFYPVIKELNVAGMTQADMLIWFGALVAVTLQTAFLSPPVAMSAYYLKQVVKEWNLSTIYNGMFQFMILQVICIGLVLSFPQIALWFPQTLQAAARAEKIPDEYKKIIEQQKKKGNDSLEDDSWGK